MERNFGRTPAGAPARLYVLDNGNLSVHVTDYGATLVSLLVPDASGKRRDVALGFDEVAGYADPASPYLGASIGRVANRIANGRFTVAGSDHQVATNEGQHHLHGGGAEAFDKVIWDLVEVSDTEVAFRHVSADGSEGYPGRLVATVRYRLVDDALHIEYGATCDQATPVNLTNHVYLNLGGVEQPGDVLDHEIAIFADGYTPTDDSLIPTGEVVEVAGTPLDLRSPKVIGAVIGALDDAAAGGFDHNFVLRGQSGGEPRLAAKVQDQTAGQVLEVFSDQPGIQFYSGNGLPDIAGKYAVTYTKRSGLCLEPQLFPDAVNQPAFLSPVLEPNERYTNHMVLRFSRQ